MVRPESQGVNFSDESVGFEPFSVGDKRHIIVIENEEILQPPPKQQTTNPHHRTTFFHCQLVVT